MTGGETDDYAGRYNCNCQRSYLYYYCIGGPFTADIFGLVISIFQTVTSIQEQTLTFVPKILAVFIGIMLIGPWMLDILSNYMVRLWTDFSVYLS